MVKPHAFFHCSSAFGLTYAMHKVILLLILLGVSLGTLARPLPDLEGWLGGGNAEGDGELWALLIAGSAGWGNYRHQADVCHAVQVLRRGGIPEERMVVMMFDDIAHNPENPRQGEIINHPKGSDVYKGVPLVSAKCNRCQVWPPRSSSRPLLLTYSSSFPLL